MDTSKNSLNGDFSFKSWFNIMWINYYIQLFILGMGITIFMSTQHPIDSINESLDDGLMAGIFTSFGFLIGPAIMGVIAYKGFYRKWVDLMTGVSE